MILSHVDGIGGPIKLLGVEFDCKLNMSTAVHKCARTAAFKTKSLLRCRRFYSLNDLVMLYKSHVLSYVEYRTPAIHLAPTSVLNELDDVQTRFLKELGLSEAAAFMNFNLAPLPVRRDIAMLGVIHRAAAKQGPPQLWQFFQRHPHEAGTRARRRIRHNLQVTEHPPGRSLDIMRRSALGMIRVYNLLPQDVVELSAVNKFQTALTNIVRGRVLAGDHRWKVVLSPRHPLFQRHPLIFAERR